MHYHSYFTDEETASSRLMGYSKLGKQGEQRPYGPQASPFSLHPWDDTRETRQRCHFQLWLLPIVGAQRSQPTSLGATADTEARLTKTLKVTHSSGEIHLTLLSLSLCVYFSFTYWISKFLHTLAYSLGQRISMKPGTVVS